MGLLVTLTGARSMGEGIWEAALQPHQVRMFGEVRHSRGDRSILLVDAPTFDSAGRSLSFDADEASAVNLGTRPIVLVIDASAPPSAAPANSKSTQDDDVKSYGPGDRDFLRLVERLPEVPRAAAQRLLAEVRSRWPGELKRGIKTNYSNTPDNFWYVVVQPRAGELSITVRGEPSRFGGMTKLQLKDDRPGYTRFKLARMEDVPDALEIIGASKRR